MKYYAEKERFRYNAEERNGKKYRIYSAEQIGEETNFSSSPPLCKKCMDDKIKTSQDAVTDSKLSQQIHSGKATKSVYSKNSTTTINKQLSWTSNPAPTRKAKTPSLWKRQKNPSKGAKTSTPQQDREGLVPPFQAPFKEKNTYFCPSRPSPVHRESSFLVICDKKQIGVKG